ncbi:MAG TPA: dihydrofolate reductase [Jiangellaceae bacterium]
MTLTAIAAVARNGVIGAQGDLPWRLPADLRRFKALTTGHVLVMGRKTFESIGRALPGRTTIVVTRRASWSAGGVLVASSVDDALAAAAGLGPETFVAGGAEIYAQTLARADRLELTEVHAEPEGDTFFPELDRSAWLEVAREPHDGFDFVSYVRR